MNSNFYQLTKVNNNNSYLDDNMDDNSYDNDENNDNSSFDDTNDEFIKFKEDVKQWITLDDDIITLQKAIKDRKSKKEELTTSIKDYMNRFKINDLNTNNGKIKFTKSLYTKPLNKQYLISRLGDFFKDFSKGEKAATFILENRDKEEKFKLKRIINKNELNL
jgi:hypothetical protein